MIKWLYNCKAMKRYLWIFVVILLAPIFVTGCEKDKDNEELAIKVTSVDDLEGKKIGVQLGTTGDIYASDYEGDEAGTKIERYNKGTDAIQALKQDKIDAVILDSEPAKAYTSINNELFILDEEFADEDYAICIAKNNTELKEKINDAITQLMEDGTLDKIKKNYTGNEDELGKYPYEKKDVERNNGTLIVATNAAFKPYEYYENGEVVGLDIDMIQAICDILGMELEIEEMDFDPIISAVMSGKVDVGVSGMTVTEDRLKNVDFSVSYTNAKQVIIVKDPNVKVESQSIVEKFKQNFIEDNRYKFLLNGLANTLIITALALVMGVVIGFIVAIITSSHAKNGNFKIANLICKIYLTVVRGTPVMVQLLIIYYVVFQTVDINKIVAAFIAFGLNSGAYVAEIIRSGIMSIDNGQFEAGRSLGLNFTKTMTHIILPQAIKNVLPALGNEFIVLIKETSISGYIGLADLTKGGDIIRSITYDNLMPLLAVAIIYLIIVVVLQTLVNKLERRLRNDGK